MRFVAWNLGHQTRERGIKGPLIDVLRFIAADVISFNEYVDGDTRKPLHASLASLGYTSITVVAPDRHAQSDPDRVTHPCGAW